MSDQFTAKRPWVTPRITPVLTGEDTEGGAVGGVTEAGHVVTSPIHCATSTTSGVATSSTSCGTGTASSS